MRFIKRLLVVTVFTLGTLSLSHAAKLPYQWHKETGMHSGRVDSINLRGRTLVVGDIEFKLSPHISVQRSSGRYSTQLDVRAGQWIDFQTAETGPGSLGGGTVTKIWVK